MWRCECGLKNSGHISDGALSLAVHLWSKTQKKTPTTRGEGQVYRR